jgi:hypothetical protein
MEMCIGPVDRNSQRSLQQSNATRCEKETVMFWIVDRRFFPFVDMSKPGVRYLNIISGLVNTYLRFLLDDDFVNYTTTSESKLDRRAPNIKFKQLRNN